MELVLYRMNLGSRSVVLCSVSEIRRFFMPMLLGIAWGIVIQYASRRERWVSSIMWSSCVEGITAGPRMWSICFLRGERSKTLFESLSFKFSNKLSLCAFCSSFWTIDFIKRLRGIGTFWGHLEYDFQLHLIRKENFLIKRLYSFAGPARLKTSESLGPLLLSYFVYIHWPPSISSHSSFTPL